MGLASTTVTVPGGSLFVEDEGSGLPVVLLHAGIVDLRAWDPLVPELVRRGFHVIRYDRRGYGRTTTEDVPFSNRADLLAVLDAFAVGRACLVGNSLGGTIAFDTAMEHPDRVAAVALIGAGIGGYEPEPTSEEAALFAEMERMEEGLEEGGDVSAVADFHVRLWVDGIGQPEGRAPGAIREAVRLMAVEACDPARFRGRPIPLDPSAAARLDAARVPILRMPILSIAGELDVSDVWATGQYLEARLPNVRAVRAPGVAHMVAMEAPALVAELVASLVGPLGTFG